ncbi:B3 domain-containing protein Os06g0112300-like [Gossypium hirsutum]|uniref:B3 domain-containing protein Os06g0112300-like n=1 Tax=Gossypium hirsutum TaxID=3635 RepID=A0ABM2Z1G8_GOSHI|nr:B3 domain-containing protein Os06g0112300-like [Gossypium hirsutum]
MTELTCLYEQSVQMNFARKYLTMMHKKVIHLLSDGNSWPVIYDPRFEWSYVFLCNGWHRFAVDNNLEVGDACVFELTGGIETSMKVNIYKKQAIEDENLGSSLGILQH